MDPSVIQEAMEEESSNNLLVVLIILVLIITILIVLLYIFKDQLPEIIQETDRTRNHVSERKKSR